MAIIVWMIIVLLYFILKPREKISEAMQTKLKDLGSKI